MLIDRVDHQDHPIGTIVRSKVFEDKANFRVSHVLIFNSSGNLLLQRLGADRDRHPLLWGSSVASYVPAGQSYATAAQDRLLGELGLEGFTLTTLGKTVMDDKGCRKFITIFTAMYDGPVEFDKSHIVELKYVSLRAVLGMAADLTPTLRHVLDSILNQNLT